MLSDIFRNLNWSVLTDALITAIPALICITIHELAHGYTAYRLGDNTAKDMGRLTLNPIKHIDIFGLLMLLVVQFGWAKPVPVSMRNFKNPRAGMAVTAIAGPLSNIILAVIVLFIYGLVYIPLGGFNPGRAGTVVMIIFERTAYISVGLAVFNLVPIPPLDGSKVVFSFLSDKSYNMLMRYERYGMIVLILIISTKVFNNTIGMLTSTLFNRFMEIASFALNLVR